MIRDATVADLAALGAVFRHSSLSNAGDRANLLAHPEVLELSDVAVRQGRTRVAVGAGGRVLGFVFDRDVETRFGRAARLRLESR